MKNLCFIVILLFGIPVYSQTGIPDNAGTPEALADVQAQHGAPTVAQADANSTKASDEILESVSQESQTTNFSTNLQTTISNLSSANSASAMKSVLDQIRSIADGCEQFTNIAVERCKDSSTCTNCETVQQAGQGISQSGQQLSQLTGSSSTGSAAACLGAIAPAGGALWEAMTAKKSCQALRQGQGSGSGRREGCSKMCREVGNLVKNFQNKLNSLPQNDPAEVPLMNQLSQQAAQIGTQARKSSTTCSNKLKEGQGKGEQQGQAVMQALNGLLQCIAGFLGQEEEEEEEVAEEDDPIDCSNSAHAAANPEYCGKATFGNTNSVLGKATPDFNLAGANTNLEETDDEFEDPGLRPFGNNDRNPAAGPNGVPPFAGGLPQGQGFGGPQAKTGGKKGASEGKARDLVAGYKTSKSGGSGGSGRRGGRGKFKFKPFKNAKAGAGDGKDGKALAALSKLVKAGISPDQSGSIFERVTKRFMASAPKENLFDFKRNKKLWMQK